MTDDPGRNLAIMNRAILAGEPVPPMTAIWWLDGCREFSEEGGSLCVCLGLRGAGRRLPSTKEAYHLRDDALRRAGELLPCGVDTKPSARAKHLGETIRRFETTTWPRVRDLQFPPDHFTDLQCALFEAFVSAGELGVPKSHRSLFGILQ